MSERLRAGKYSKLYTLHRWRKFRKSFLDANPLCSICKAMGRVTTSNVVDHKVPHKGDMIRFWSGPFQALCQACHNSAKQQQEKSGSFSGCGTSGQPIDDGHHWNTQRQDIKD